ncbi:MAG TPA: hypothetical protein VFP36_04505 [Usitatibacter sp.]|nr:hypothetical protein [Usitatibacter sp.]
MISKRILDRLIRAKLVQLDSCAGVQVLPVVVSRGSGNGCNWTVTGWTGDAQIVDRCRDKMRGYLEFLQGQFDITEP